MGPCSACRVSDKQAAQMILTPAPIYAVKNKLSSSPRCLLLQPYTEISLAGHFGQTVSACPLS